MKLIYTFLLFSIGLNAQVDPSSELYKTLKQNDSILFEITFNQCDPTPLTTFLANDLEFYHDQGGITKTKATFIEIFKSGICGNPDFRSRRVLVDGSLEVFPLYSNGKLYGAIQKGVHKFFEKPKDKPEVAGNIARFTHLWLLEDEQWVLKRALSYDHKM